MPNNTTKTQSLISRFKDLLAYLPPLRKAGPALLWSVVGFGVVTIIFGLSRWFWLSLLMLMLSGGLDTISVVIRHTLVQIRTPDHLARISHKLRKKQSLKLPRCIYDRHFSSFNR